MKKTRIMYIEHKPRDRVRPSGPARIGRMTFSKTGRTVYYGGKAFQSLKGSGIEGNYVDIQTGDEYWISGCKRDGTDRLFNRAVPVEIDADVADEYWTEIRGRPSPR